MPVFASTMNSTTSASSMAVSACARTAASIGPAFGSSSPPVSTSANSRPRQSAVA